MLNLRQCEETVQDVAWGLESGRISKEKAIEKLIECAKDIRYYRCVLGSRHRKDRITVSLTGISTTDEKWIRKESPLAKNWKSKEGENDDV